MTIINLLSALVVIPLSIGFIAPLLMKSRLNTPIELLWPLSTLLSLGVYSMIFTVVAFYEMTSTKAWIILILLWATTIYFGNKPKRKYFMFSYWHNIKNNRNETLAITCMIIVFIIITAQATYYPFIGDDEISRYAYFAKLLFENGYLLDTIRGYPLMLPAIYASNFYMSGYIIEQVAKLYPVIISLMTVCTTYGLALHWFNKKTAYTAALIISSTPLFIQWSPIGYVDIATGLCLSVCAFTIEIWRKNLKSQWALIVGMLIGISLWTKQTGFIVFIPLTIILMQQIIQTYRTKQKRHLYHLAFQIIIIITTSLIMGGWWYIRNIYYDGLKLAFPNAGLYHIMQSTHNINHFIPFLGDYQQFGFITSPIYVVGLIWAIYKHKLHSIKNLLVWCMPLTLLWWWWFSFDARFLLAVLPFYAIIAGASIDNIYSIINSKIHSNFYQIATKFFIVTIVITGVIQARLGGIIQWVINPNTSYSEKLYRAKGDLYPTVEYIREHASVNDRIYSTDGRIRYYINYPIKVGYPSLEELLEYDLFIVGSRAQSVYNFISSTNSNTINQLSNQKKSQVVYTGPNNKIIIYKLNKD